MPGAGPTDGVHFNDKLAANYLAFIKLASIRIWLRAYESTPYIESVLRKKEHTSSDWSELVSLAQVLDVDFALDLVSQISEPTK